MLRHAGKVSSDAETDNMSSAYHEDESECHGHHVGAALDSFLTLLVSRATVQSHRNRQDDSSPINATHPTLHCSVRPSLTLPAVQSRCPTPAAICQPGRCTAYHRSAPSCAPRPSLLHLRPLQRHPSTCLSWQCSNSARHTVVHGTLSPRRSIGLRPRKFSRRCITTASTRQASHAEGVTSVANLIITRLFACEKIVSMHLGCASSSFSHSHDVGRPRRYLFGAASHGVFGRFKPSPSFAIADPHTY